MAFFDIFAQYSILEILNGVWIVASFLLNTCLGLQLIWSPNLEWIHFMVIALWKYLSIPLFQKVDILDIFSMQWKYYPNVQICNTFPVLKKSDSRFPVIRCTSLPCVKYYNIGGYFQWCISSGIHSTRCLITRVFP